MSAIRIYFEIFCIALVAAMSSGGTFLLSTPADGRYDWIRAGIIAAVSFASSVMLSVTYYRDHK